jgi:hypothetical protein
MNISYKTALLTLCFCAAAQSQIAPANDLNLHSKLPPHGAGSVHYANRPYQPSLSARQAAVANAAVATLPTWQAKDGVYTYQMIGANPMAAGSNATTTINTNVVPLILTFSDGTTLDPTVASACASQAVPQSLVLSSPVFNNFNYSPGGVNVGNTQYTDFFQRANFWQSTGPAGINPNYHVLLAPSPAAAVRIAVPAAKGQMVSAPCGRLGEMDINWFDSYLQSTVFPQLSAAGVMPSTFPVFILYNTVMYDTTASNCCILGYHSAFNNQSFSRAIQTYAVADFDVSGDFGSTQDAAALSHEVGEWLDNPIGTNPTPPWGHIGQVSGCQADLEVGDPLSGQELTVPMSNGFNYHMQELAFKSWFYRDSPSSGVNGWYSSNGTFTTPSTPCNASVTALTISPTSIAAGSAATVTVNVTAAAGSSGTPTGQVTLTSSNGAATLATLTLSGGHATSAAVFPAGSYTVTANYSGDAAFSASSSSAVAITVGSASVSLGPAALTFISQSTGTSSAAQAVTLRNQGTAALSIASISFTGVNPADFSQTNSCGASVAAGASCSISVTFKPAAAGSRSALLSVADNVTGSPQTVVLSGTGAAGGPIVTLSAGSLIYPATAVGAISAVQSVSITNTGSAALTGLDLSLSGSNPGDFMLSANCPATLAVNASCSVSLQFRPASAGSRTANLNISNNATGSPQKVVLSGTGTGSSNPIVSLSATSLTFAPTLPGSSSAAQNMTITNTGNVALTGLALSLTGANAGDWGGNTTCGSTLAVNVSCRVSLFFRPTAVGARTGALTIRSNAASSPDNVALSGTGAR